MLSTDDKSADGILIFYARIGSESRLTQNNPSRMKFKVVFLSFLLYGLVSNAQEAAHKIDSLTQVLKRPAADTAKVKTYIAIAEQYYISSPPTAIKYCIQAKDLSERIRFQDGLANAYGWLAFLFEQEGNIEKALQYNYKALAISIKAKNKKDQGTILNNIAAIYKDQGKIIEALNFHQRSLLIKKEIGDKNGISASYNNIGLIYSSQGKIEEALDYYSRSLKIEEDLKNAEGISTGLGNIAAVYKDQHEYEKANEYLLRALKINTSAGDKYAMGYTLNGLGNLSEETRHLNQALSYFNQSLAVRKDINDKQGIANSLKNIGNLYKKLGKTNEAEAAFKNSLQNFEELGDKLGIAIVNNLLGEIAVTKGNLAEAENYFNHSLALAQQLGYPMNISNAAKNLQQIYREKGSWQKALSMNDIYIRMRDSVQNDKNRTASMRAQFKYDFEQQIREEKLAKAKRLAEQERTRNIQYALIAVGILIFTVLFLLISQTIIANTRMIQFFGVITLLIVFEFFNLLLHPFLEKITHHSTLYMLLAMVCIASLLVPMHHKIEKWATTTLIEKNKKVRLANARKTIQELEDKELNSTEEDSVLS